MFSNKFQLFGNNNLVFYYFLFYLKKNLNCSPYDVFKNGEIAKQPDFECKIFTEINAPQ